MSVTARDARYFALTVALAALFVASYVLVTGLTAPKAPAFEPYEAPDLVMPTTQNHTFDLDGTRGGVVVLDFFATWCVPCQTVERHLLELAADPSVGTFQVVGVGVSWNEDMETLRAYREEHGLPWIVGKADNATVAAWEVQRLAHVVVLDSDGTVVMELTGLPAKNELADAIRGAQP